MLESGHAYADFHVIQETYCTSDHQIFNINGNLDFGVKTYRVLKDVCTFEDLHKRSYDRGFMPLRILKQSIDNLYLRTLCRYSFRGVLSLPFGCVYRIYIVVFARKLFLS